MKNRNDIILSSNPKGKEYTVGNIIQLIEEKNKDELASFLYDRFYFRYIHPFKPNSKDYKTNYKNGFSIMVNSCLLIEAYTSFIKSNFVNTKSKCEKTYGWFFSTHDAFKEFRQNGLSTKEYLKEGRIRNKGVPLDFYKNVRCALLHNGETRNKWLISRKGKLIDTETKRINSVKFLQLIEDTIKIHCNNLKQLDINHPKWRTYINRLEKLIKNL